MYRESLHIQYAVKHQQYNCNQERIENNELIGFANARGQVQAFQGYRIAFFAQPKPFQRRYQHSVILSSMWNQCVHPNLIMNIEQNLYKFC